MKRMLVLIALLAPACTEDPTGCILIGTYALNVTVLDSISGARVPGYFPVIATDGTYSDTTDVYTLCVQHAGCSPSATITSFPLAPSRPGVYRVQVYAPGYQPWTRDSIRVRADRCGIAEQVAVTARVRK